MEDAHQTALIQSAYTLVAGRDEVQQGLDKNWTPHTEAFESTHSVFQESCPNRKDQSACSKRNITAYQAICNCVITLGSCKSTLADKGLCKALRHYVTNRECEEFLKLAIWCLQSDLQPLQGPALMQSVKNRSRPS